MYSDIVLFNKGKLLKKQVGMMSVKQIYNELALNQDDEYYIELARNNVMTIPVLIDIMLEESFMNASRAQKLLEKISENNPESVYPFFDYIAKGLENANSFLAWNVWKIIANLVYVDAKEKWSKVSEQFYIALNSELITEFSIACDCAQKIIAAKPNESEVILEILKNAGKRPFKISGELSESSQAVAAEKVQEFFENVMNS